MSGLFFVFFTKVYGSWQTLILIQMKSIAKLILYVDDGGITGMNNDIDDNDFIYQFFWWVILKKFKNIWFYVNVTVLVVLGQH